MVKKKDLVDYAQATIAEMDTLERLNVLQEVHDEIERLIERYTQGFLRSKLSGFTDKNFQANHDAMVRMGLAVAEEF